MSTSNPHLALSLAPTLNFTQNLRTLLDTLTPASIPSTLAQLHALALAHRFATVGYMRLVCA